MKTDPRTIIRKLLVTEKGTQQGSAGKYLFEVEPSANKIEIKRAVESLFNVSVTRVNTMTVKGKRKRERTVRFGKRADWKKAIVTLKEGSKIDLG